MTDSTLTPPAADMMSFLSTTPEHKNSEYETPVVELPGVRYLPWPGWPGKTLGQATPGQGWFWQQNSEGRYVDALRLVENNRREE